MGSGTHLQNSRGSVEPIEFRRWVPEPMDLEKIVKQIQDNKMFEL